MKNLLSNKNQKIGLILIVIGIIIFAISAPITTSMNSGEFIGIFVVSFGVVFYIYGLYQIFDADGKSMPIILDNFFPSYPVVKDSEDLHKRLTGFRKAYADYISNDFKEENSSLQNHATQMFWHSLSLQKRRLIANNMSIKMDTMRRAYSSVNTSVRSTGFFDGRYHVSEVYEEISSKREYMQGNKRLFRRNDKEVARYAILSAEQVGDSKVVCPNCGNASDRSNLIDGCDFCGCKFTVNDLQNRIGSFGFRKDYIVNKSKYEAVRETIGPWLCLFFAMPMVVFGLIGAPIYLIIDNIQNGSGNSIFAIIGASLIAAVLFALLGWCFGQFALYVVLPVVQIFASISFLKKRHSLYRSPDEIAAENKMTEFVRKHNPQFSMQNFYGEINNRLAAIHYADSELQINAFSTCSLKQYLEKYKNVVDLDVTTINLEKYDVTPNYHYASVKTVMNMLVLEGSRIKSKSETVYMKVGRSAYCKSQTTGPRVFNCPVCGANHSLMDGRKCRYCGNEMHLEQYDWVITEYKALG